MFNFFYIILSLIIIGGTYYFYLNKNKKNTIPVNAKKVDILKKKFNIKSTETSFKYGTKISESLKSSDSVSLPIKSVRKIPPKIDIIPIPNNCLSSNIQIESVPIKLIEKLQKNIDIQDFDIYNIVCSFLNSKLIFTKLFTNQRGEKIITSIDSFITNYKNIITNDFNGHNILLKLSDDFANEKYIYMKKNTLIKITKSDDYQLLYDIISKEKVFLLCDKSKFYVCIGDIFTSDINKNQIKNIFFNKLDINDPKIASNYELFCKYNKLTIIYWISTKIVNDNTNTNTNKS